MKLFKVEIISLELHVLGTATFFKLLRIKERLFMHAIIDNFLHVYCVDDLFGTYPNVSGETQFRRPTYDDGL